MIGSIENNPAKLRQLIEKWALELGFDQIGIADTNLEKYIKRYQDWIDQSFHGELHYLEKNTSKRFSPEKLTQDTLRVISVRINYLPEQLNESQEALENKKNAYISRYALGKDYHKLIRKKLQKLADRIMLLKHDFGYRAFCDSAPVLEKAFAEKSGIGWLGKHTNIINNKAGSFFFLGELFTNIPFPVDAPMTAHCGTCTSCIDVCPTKAIIAPYKLDARRCISYLTIELKGSIPNEFRRAIGNRIFGCDDCQLFCPWNKYAKKTAEPAFYAKKTLKNNNLLDFFSWSELEFKNRMAGSAIRRINHQQWLRNIAIALGNAPYSRNIIKTLKESINETTDPMVKEHIAWAIKEQKSKASKA